MPWARCQPGARRADLVVEAFEVEAGPPRRDRDAQPAGGGWIRHAVVHVDLLLTLNRITRRPQTIHWPEKHGRSRLASGVIVRPDRTEDRFLVPGEASLTPIVVGA